MQSIARNLQREDVSTVVADGGCDPAGRALFHQEDYAASATRATGFGGPSAMRLATLISLSISGVVIPGRIGAAQLPLLAQQACDLVPFGVGKCLMHGTAQFRRSARSCGTHACRR